MSIGQRIKNTRENIGMSQSELAKRSHISKQLLYKYENEIITNIPSDKIERISSALGIAPAYLMGWENPSENDSNSNPSSPNTSATDDDIKFALFNSKDGITDEMLDEVKEFAKFVKSKYKK